MRKRLNNLAGSSIFILAPLLMAGCGGSGGATVSGGTRRTTTTYGKYRSLEFTGGSTIFNSRGEKISIAFTVKNVGSEEISYQFGGCAEYFATIQQGARVVAYVTVAYGCGGIVREGIFTTG